MPNSKKNSPRLTEEILHNICADSFLITNPVNIFYLTGFSGTLGYLLMTWKGFFFITDSRYLEYAQETVRNARVLPLGNGIAGVLKGIIKKTKPRSMAYEYGTVSHHFFNRVIRPVSPGRLVAAKDCIEDMRMIKSARETAKIKKACDIVRSSVDAVEKRFEKYRGRTEKDLADGLEQMFRNRGAESSAFPTIVAEGPHSSRPHHHPSPTRITGRRPLLIDAGVVYEKYNSDLTRTLCNHTISKKFAEIVRVVREAQSMAFCVIKSGAMARDVDRAARAHIRKCGYGDFFGHGLGHGVGLEVHEKPHISLKSRDILASGMVFTVEPGIYIPGKYGCRIEDVVEVTQSGCRVLTAAEPF